LHVSLQDTAMYRQNRLATLWKFPKKIKKKRVRLSPV
jgi:hypothetical protein